MQPNTRAFGCEDQETLQKVQGEERIVMGKYGKFISGNLTPKSTGGDSFVPRAVFFQNTEKEITHIRRQTITLVSSYYC